MANARAFEESAAVRFDVPRGACDCHTHIFGDPREFPFDAGRSYTPEPALPEEMRALHRQLAIDRVVIVTASVYGTDNRSTLFGIRARGRDARGVAVIDERTSDSELDALAKGGVCGIRLNLATAGVNDPAAARARFEASVERVRKRGWHVQIFTTPPVIEKLADLVAAAPVEVVFDHFGGAQAGDGVDQPGFAPLLDLVSAGRAWVKISGAYRASQRGPEYADVVPLARALISANADRIVWGTDWPHPSGQTPAGRKSTDVTPNLEVDDARLLSQLAVWAPDAAVRQKILVDNPARLYRY
jgi:predicted TIM-barrel fold metal-dependent hydrolase